MSETVLITGASGFIGRHLSSALLNSGFVVRATIRSASSPAVSDERLEWIPIGDIGPTTDWSAATRDVDYVVHLAGLAHRVGIRERDIESDLYRINTEGTRTLANAVAGTPSIKRIVFVSSAKAVFSSNGNAGIEAAEESIYGRSKSLAEQALREVLNDGQPDWCILRPCMVYGPGNPGNMSRLIDLVHAGLPLPFGAIRNRRSVLFVGNLVDAISCCLTNPVASRRAFSVADGEPVSTPELVLLLGRYCNKSVRLLPVPVLLMRGIAHLGDLAKLAGANLGWDSYSVDRLCGSLVINHSEIQSALGWVPRFSTAAGLKLTVESARISENG